MILTRRLHSLMWLGALVLALLITAAITLKVNAEKSRVKLAEAQLVALKREAVFLETEFETRANQSQLADLNTVDFGYRAPGAGQYLENERQLAALGKPRGADAPAPIRMASADVGEDQTGIIPAMVSPLTGRFVGQAEAAEPGKAHHRAFSAAGLRDRLSRVEPLARSRGNTP